jgi:hypothetical protein
MPCCETSQLQANLFGRRFNEILKPMSQLGLPARRDPTSLLYTGCAKETIEQRRCCSSYSVCG